MSVSSFIGSGYCKTKYSPWPSPAKDSRHFLSFEQSAWISALSHVTGFSWQWNLQIGILHDTFMLGISLPTAMSHGSLAEKVSGWQVFTTMTTVGYGAQPRFYRVGVDLMETIYSHLGDSTSSLPTLNSGSILCRYTFVMIMYVFIHTYNHI